MLDRRTLRFAILLLVIATACGGGGEPPPDGGRPDATPQGDGGGEVTCRFDDDCLDGLFCDGMEFCDPSAAGADERGCVEPGSPCGGDEICEEESDRCRVDCPVEPDMDGDGHLAVECGGDDCDDSDAARYPGNPEICDAVGHDEDCNPSTVGFVDADGDGAGSAACCNGTLCGPDCDDTNAAINPGEVDGPPLTCDGLDNDCDGTPDEGCPCIEGATAECGTPVQIMRIGLCRPGTQLCSGGTWTETCIGGAIPQEELCDEQDNDCDAMTDEGVLRAYYVDADADGYGIPDDAAVTGDEPLYACSQPAGYARNTDDCDDTRTGVSPAASEVCNGIDDNCDGTTDEGLRASFYRDADGDGFGSTAMTTMACTAPPGYVTSSTDCDDTRASVNPAALELCDGVDNNCDTSTDPGCECSDGATPRACGTSDTGACQMGTQRCVGGTWAECVGAIEPRAEVCNGADDDCDGMEDEGLVVTPCYLDADSDGRGSGPATTQCEDPARTAFGRCPSGYSNVAGDCNDANASIRPGATESCNGADDDCDGTADEGVRNTYYLDADSDGFGVTGSTTQACSPPAGYVAASGDCDDSSPSVHPGATEFCDAVDQDCVPGNEPTRTFYRDMDGDLYGVASMTTQACAPPSGYVEYPGDCDDSNNAVRPGVSELCDGIDNDCDAVIDDGAAASCSGLYPFATHVTAWACTAGACAPGCSGSWRDCDGNLASGCEIDSATNLDHCGSCGNACGAAGSCTTGTCDQVAAITAGDATTCVRRTNGRVACWGSGDNGEMGDGRLSDGLVPTANPDLYRIDTFISVGHAFASSAAASSFVHAFSDYTHILYGWGSNNNGQLGDGTTIAPRARPVIVTDYPTRWAYIAGDGNFACGIRGAYVSGSMNSVVCWGLNSWGVLGNGCPSGTSEVVTIPPTTGITGSSGATDVAAGLWYACMVTASGGVSCWGTDRDGRLGDGGAIGGDTANCTPIAVSLPGGFTAVDVEIGTDHACAISTTGSAVCWGDNDNGQLGDASTTDRSAPVALGGGLTWSRFGLGADHSCGISTAGRLYCWGDDAFGQVGNGATTGDQTSPVAIGTATNWVDVASGDHHTCAVNAAGDVYCWGHNQHGQLGLGDTANRNAPVLVQGI